MRQLYGLLAALCVATVLALSPVAQAQVPAVQSTASVTEGHAESPASAPSDITRNRDLESQEMKRRSSGTGSFGGLASQGRSSGMAGLWLQTALVLGIVLVAMWLVLKWLRKRGIGVTFGGSNSPIQVLNRGYLTGKHQMVMVRFGSRVLLLGVSPQSVNVLSEMSSPEETAQILGRLESTKDGSASQDFRQAIDEAADEYAEQSAGPGAQPVVHTPSREQIGEIRGEIRGLLSKMQSLGKSRKVD